MAETPFGGLLEGLLTGKEMQMQRARQIADQTFRDSQINLQMQKFRSDEEQRGIDNRMSQQRLDDALMMGFQKMNEDAYQFDTQQNRFAEERKSREEVARIKAESAKQIAEAKNLTLEDRYLLGEAMKHADTPEAALGLADYIRSRLRPNAASETPASTTVPPATPSATPAPVQMAPPAPPVDLNQLFGTPGAFATPQAAQGELPRGFDPSQPFGGTAGAQAKSRAAYADMIAQKSAQLQQRLDLDILKANASVAHQNALTEKLKTMTPVEKELVIARKAEMEDRMRVRSLEMAAKERNTQWEQSYKTAALDLRKRMAGGSLDSLRQRRSSAGREMVALGQNRDKLIGEIDRLTTERDRRVPSLVQGGLLEGPSRDQRIRALQSQLEEVSTVHQAAKENYQHYTRILEETGNLTIPKKPEPGTEKFGTYYQTPAGQKELRDSRAQQKSQGRPQARVAPPQPGAKGTAKITLSNGVQMPAAGQSVGQMVEAQMQQMQSRKTSAPTKGAPTKKRETDADIMARLRKRYGN